MNEEQWLTSSKPGPLLEFLRRSGSGRFRKFRLFSVACCRRIWGLMTDERSRRVVTEMEWHTDRAIPAAEWTVYRQEATQVYAELVGHPNAVRAERNQFVDWQAEAVSHAADAAYILSIPPSRLTDLPGNPMRVSSAVADAVCYAAGVENGIMRAAKDAEEANQVPLIHCIFGNPFRPYQPLASSVFIWNDGIIVRMANAIYDDRILPGGEFKRDRLAVLADAMEEVGADGSLV
jgi:hypothetical protein